MLVMRTQNWPCVARTNGSTASVTPMSGEPQPTRVADAVFVSKNVLHGRGQARSATRSPSRPDGRNTSTAISTRKANTSW